MFRKKRDKNKRGSKSKDISKLSLFQRPGTKSYKQCPLSGKNAPIIDYKNIRLLKKYISGNGKLLPSRITSVSLKKQRQLKKRIVFRIKQL